MGYVEELRKLIGTRTLIMPGVRAVIRDEAGAVLLQLRGDLKVWGLPAGSMELTSRSRTRSGARSTRRPA